MSRRNLKPHHKASKPTPRPSGAGGLGLKAFHLGNYSEAIRFWNELDAGDEPAVCAAVAEAHFRRALATRLTASEALADLRHAVDLLPDEARYWYQLGLMLHRNDHLEEARQAYARAADLGLARRGIGLVRGLAELEVDSGLSLDTLPWLTPEARTSLAPIAGLLRGEPPAAQALPARADASSPPGTIDPVTSLWQGLTLLARGDALGAYAALSPPKGQRLPVGAEPTRAFYFGVAAALGGKPPLALSVWREMLRVSSPAAGASPPHLNAYLSQISAHSILALQQEGRWEEALDQAQSSAALAPGDTWLLKAALIAANRLAVAAREAGEWNTAVGRWLTMRGLLETHPGLGPLPPILHNLAIAYEALQAWESAAQAWVALLNTLPRRSGRTPKNPLPTTEGPTLEEQRAWMRRRILDNYGRAKLPDEAISYYKQAVKADPENMDLRLEMVSALLANEQSIAARNEVQRILAKDPKQIDALLLLAEIHQARAENYAAERALSRILEIDSNHDTARKAIRQMMLERGMDAFNSGMYYEARDIYTAALTYAPDDPQLLVFLGQAELVLGRKKNAQAHFDAALATGSPAAYIQLFSFRGRSFDEAEARKILRRAEEAGLATFDLYMSAGVVCLTRRAPSGPAVKPYRTDVSPVWEKWGRELIEKGLELATDRADALESLLSALGPGYAVIAVDYARQLVALRPEDPECLLDLAFYQGIARDVAGGKTTLAQAERLARKQGRKDLLNSIAEMRQKIGSPMFGMLASVFGTGGLDPDDEEFFR